jgi:hypothetical protein
MKAFSWDAQILQQRIEMNDVYAKGSTAPGLEDRAGRASPEELLEPVRKRGVYVDAAGTSHLWIAQLVVPDG